MAVLAASGCQAYLPHASRQPTVYNPFPQLSRVAVLPFINHSTEPTVDGRQFALAYSNELQSTPGFEVVPFTVVETKLRQLQAEFAGPLAGQIDARRLAQALEVDAVVVGAITDFTPYYPPRLAMTIEWYAANPCFHPIPPGYGLPWGTPDEEMIPGSLVFEAEMALAREQLKTQEPLYPLPAPLADRHDAAGASDAGAQRSDDNDAAVRHAQHVGPSDTTATVIAGTSQHALPHNWPDPRGFTPPPPSAQRPPCRETFEPVLRHTAAFNGHDSDFTTALETYVYFRDDARFGGWQSYLQRSDDFIRFCCHMHIAQMLTARGGAGETRLVWRWPVSR
jgi:hypothetical protein